MPVKRSSDKQKPAPNPRDLPRRGPLSASQAFVPPEFAREDVNKVWQKPYRCACCNREYDSQQGNFFKTRSELFSAANGYVTICKKCIESYYTHSAVTLRNEHQALLHVAQMLDWYVSDEMIDSILADPNTKKPVNELARRLSLKGASEGTYLTALQDGVVAIAPEAIAEEPAEQKTEIDPRAVELFGLGYSADEYEILIQHYDMLTKQFVNADSVQDSLIKDLCTTKLMQMQQRGDPDSYAKLTKLYAEILKSSGLQ